MARGLRAFGWFAFAAGLTLLALAVAGRLSSSRHAHSRRPEASQPDSTRKLPAARESLGVAIAVSPEWVASRAPSIDSRASDLGPSLALIDARAPSEFARSHIAGAISVPADSAASLQALVTILTARGLTGGETLVCYADSASIEDAAHLFWLLESAGARAARFLDGGVEAWRAGGHALEEGAPPAPAGSAAAAPARWRPAPDSTRSATLESVRDHFGAKEIEIFDARGALAWESPDAHRFESQWGRAGHIPHALPFEFREMFREDGALLPIDELRKRIRQAGPRPATPVSLESEIIVYDDGGGREAALGYLVTRAAGVERVRCFVDGWARWSADAALPVVRIVGADTIASRVAADARRALPGTAPDHILLDMRTTNDYKSGHIPGAVLLAAHQFEDSLDVVVARLWPGIDRARMPLTTYCYGEDCIRSRNGCTWAARRGFLHLEWFRGGIAEWERARNHVVLGPLPDEE